MRFLRLFWCYLRIAAKLEAAYAEHFFLQIFESGLGLLANLLWLYIVFARTPKLGNWTSEQLLILIGVHFLVKGVLAFSIQPSMKALMDDVRTGDLDFLLMKPADAQLIVSIREIRLTKLIDVILGVSLIITGCMWLSAPLSLAQLLRFGMMLLIGLTMVYSIWFILATLSFWLIRTENLDLIFLRMYNAGRWPLNLFPWWLRALLTVVVPVASSVIVPAEVLAGLSSSKSVGLSIAGGLMSLAFARWLWRVALRNYVSASGE